MNIGTVWTGNKFSEQYFWNLYAMLKRNISEPFNFYVISDQTHVRISRYEDVIQGRFNILKAKTDRFGWWHFMEYFSGELPTPMIYFGLDTVITGDITEAMQRRTFTMSKDFNYLIGNPNPKLANTYADCACVIPEGGLPWLYKKFEHQNFCVGLGKDHSTLMHVWVSSQLRMYGVVPDLWQDISPGLMCSYKWPAKKLEQPPEPMVFWHGVPQIHECLNEAPWIKEHWRSDDL